MFEIDKEQFGAFVATRRKEKQFTQKELAQRLFVSDKAVSKWERGLSMPDVQLLIPLAEQLDVTVTELLNCQRTDSTEAIDAAQVETLVQKAICLSEGERQQQTLWQRKGVPIFVLAMLLVCAELALLRALQILTVQNQGDIFLLEGLCALFGAYFFLFSKETLPAYYDTNKINAYVDGVFRLNLVGVSFNNRNWPRVMAVCRWWIVLTAILTPLGYAVLLSCGSLAGYVGLRTAAILLVLGSLFVPLYFVAKKYE